MIEVTAEFLEQFVSDDDCEFDHHGGCQAHMYLDLEPGEICPQQQLKQVALQARINQTITDRERVERQLG